MWTIWNREANPKIGGWVLGVRPYMTSYVSTGILRVVVAKVKDGESLETHI